MQAPWEDRMSGAVCPFCLPRETIHAFNIEIAKLTTSTLYLGRTQVFRGYCILIFDPRHVTGLQELTSAENRAFADDLRHAAEAIDAAVHPDLLNYEVIGMGIPHLHWHIIPRYKSDPRWGYPVWADPPGMPEILRPTLSDQEYTDLVELIRSKL